MIIWAILLLLGFVFYFNLKKESSSGRKQSSQTIRSIALILLIVNLLVMILFNESSPTRLTYFVLGLGTMAVIGIVIEVISAHKQKRDKCI